MFREWLPLSGFPAYTPQLHEIGQSTLEINSSPTGRGGPFASPS